MSVSMACLCNLLVARSKQSKRGQSFPGHPIPNKWTWRHSVRRALIDLTLEPTGLIQHQFSHRCIIYPWWVPAPLLINQSDLNRPITCFTELFAGQVCNHQSLAEKNHRHLLRVRTLSSWQTLAVNLCYQFLRWQVFPLIILVLYMSDLILLPMPIRLVTLQWPSPRSVRF